MFLQCSSCIYLHHPATLASGFELYAAGACSLSSTSIAVLRKKEVVEDDDPKSIMEMLFGSFFAKSAAGKLRRRKKKQARVCVILGFQLERAVRC